MYSVYDIETLKGLFLYASKNLSTGKISVFRIDQFRNDLYALIKHLREETVEYLVSYNGISFDAQVIQFILDSFEQWADFSNRKIVRIIYQYAQDLIDDGNYGIRPKYREYEFWRKQIDLFRIHHFDNKNRRCSLKWLEFSMDMLNIEEMPIDHSCEELSEDQIAEVIHYCLNDIAATERFFDVTRGITELEEYSGKDKIQDRLDLISEFSLPATAMNWSDVKIGDELNKRGYAREAGVELSHVYYLKETRKSNSGFTFGDCIPEYIKFKTLEFQDFLKYVRQQRVDLNKDEQEFPISLNGTVYKIKKGGIHSSEGKRIVIPGAGELLIDADVGSQYPNAIVKRNLYPAHLGSRWLINYRKTIQLRLDYKKKSQDPLRSPAERRKYKGLAEMLKLALNGGGFGKTNERTNWQYDPFVHFSCTIGNQFEMLMLIEELESNGIHVISANTDGLVCLLSKEQEANYFQVCAWWENAVGNSVMGKLEFTYYQKLIQASVNHYLAIKVDNEIKRVGDFSVNMELHQNKSRRIVPIAVEEYFVNSRPVEETIRKHQNIFDFCIGVKSSRDYHYEAVDIKTNTRDLYHRIIRYFVSKGGKKLIKVKNAGSLKKGRPLTQCEAGRWLSQVYNVADRTATNELDIDYAYYITKAKNLISELEQGTGSKNKKVVSNPNQLSMF